MPNEPKFQAHLQRGGTGPAEMRRMLEAYAGHGDYAKLKAEAFGENLLGKTSDYIVKDNVYAFKRRFLLPSDLPSAGIVAQAMASKMTDAAKTQILLPYFLHSDALAENCFRSLVLPRLGTRPGQLERSEVEEHVISLASSHPELKEWASYLRLRWTRGFMNLLRQFGLLEGHPSTQLQRLWLLPESFAFFLLWMWWQSKSLATAHEHVVWELLHVDGAAWSNLLDDGQVQGWWQYQRAGSIVSFQPRNESVEEWIRYGLA